MFLIVLLHTILTNILKPQASVKRRAYLSRKWMGKPFGLYSSENRIYLHTPWKLYPLKLHPNYKYAHIYSASCQRDQKEWKNAKLAKSNIQNFVNARIQFAQATLLLTTCDDRFDHSIISTLDPSCGFSDFAPRGAKPSAFDMLRVSLGEDQSLG